MSYEGRDFLKMHGLGNDFVVLDARRSPVSLSEEQARRIADRRFGIGCDQIVLLEPPKDKKADARVRFLNSDGSEAGACGNGSRCAAWLILRETGSRQACLETSSGLLECQAAGELAVTVDMGPARLAWNEIPLAGKCDTLHLGIGAGPLADPAAVSMGNPHAVFFVPNMAKIDLVKYGPVIERHPLFPERTNVEAVQVLGTERLRMRVWERGSGVTMACGTGACAALVAAVRRKLIPGRKAEVVLDGGSLDIEWLEDGRVLMTGPVATSFAGRMGEELFR
jgi:diaminopimelate epimerase